MFRAVTRLALVLAVLAAPLSVQAADIPPIEYRERVLDNGLRVVIVLYVPPGNPAGERLAAPGPAPRPPEPPSAD